MSITLSNCLSYLSKTQLQSIYCHIRKTRAVNLHIWQAGTNVLQFYLKNYKKQLINSQHSHWFNCWHSTYWLFDKFFQLQNICCFFWYWIIGNLTLSVWMDYRTCWLYKDPGAQGVKGSLLLGKTWRIKFLTFYGLNAHIQWKD